MYKNRFSGYYSVHGHLHDGQFICDITTADGIVGVSHPYGSVDKSAIFIQVIEKIPRKNLSNHILDPKFRNNIYYIYVQHNNFNHL